jgi:hypothetical protein
MTQYQVATENFYPAPFGSTVSGDDLVGCNVDALVAAGHLVPVKDPTDTAKAVDKKEK